MPLLTAEIKLIDEVLSATDDRRAVVGPDSFPLRVVMAIIGGIALATATRLARRFEAWWERRTA